MSIAKVLQNLLERAKEPLEPTEVDAFSIVMMHGYREGFVAGQQHALRVAADEINKHLLGEDKK